MQGRSLSNHTMSNLREGKWAMAVVDIAASPAVILPKTVRPPLLRPEAGGADHLGPFRGLLLDQPGEFDWRAGQRLAADRGEARLHCGIGDRSVDFAIEFSDDLGRRVFRRRDA